MRIDETFDHTQMIERNGKLDESINWSARPYTMRAKAVCASCNNGWMSRLEEAAQRLLLGMVDGRGRELHRGGQLDLAVWGLLKAMMFDHAAPQNAQTMFRSFYGHLFEQLEPPLGIWIWLASYVGDWPGFTGCLAIEATPRGEAKPPHRNVFVRTFSVGPVVFQVFGTTNQRLAELGIGFPQRKPHGKPPIHQLWPYEASFTWKPRPGLDDEGLVSYTNSIVAALIAESERFTP